MLPTRVLPTQSSGRVEKARSLVALDILLIFGKALICGITKASTPCSVLALQHKMHEQRATHKEDELISQNHAMAGPVPRPLALDEDVGRHNAIQIAPSDDHAENNGALQRAFCVVREP
jgi:hypothetical protein